MANSRRQSNVTSLMVAAVGALLLFGVTGPVVAQPSPGGERPGVRESNSPMGNTPAERMPRGARSGIGGDVETTTPTDPENPFSVTVELKHATKDAAFSNREVTLRASRPKGPFERSEPTPKYEWTQRTGDDATVTFKNVPGSLTETGLELYAMASYKDVTYKSQRVPAATGTRLTIEAFETTQSLDNLSYTRLRTVVKPWEGYLVFTQFYTLKLTGDRALDATKPLAGRDQPGIPVALPLQAEGIQVQTGAKHKTVNSTVFWQGMLRPGQSVPLRVRFSISASKPTFEYKQTLDYPADAVEVIAPIDVRYEKVPRLSDLRVAAPGFETVETTSQIQNLRRNTDYIYAHGRSLDAGETLRFKLYGLPFEEPVLPWVVFGLGLLCALGVVGFAIREKELMSSDEATETAISVLEQEKEELLDELAHLEKEWEDGDIDEVDYETERLRLRERLALVTRKLDELRDE